MSAKTMSGLGWGRLAILAMAVAWLGGAIGFVVGDRDQIPAAGTADVGYLQDMITHHEQALEMANLELLNGESPDVQIYAREILLFQSYEIGLMEARLRDWGYLRENRSASAMEWMGMPVPVESMPGLATEAQMVTLRDAEGAEADRLFLELMAVHHRGGVDMGFAGAERANDEWVADLAARQAENQILEINEFILTSEKLDLEARIEPYE